MYVFDDNHELMKLYATLGAWEVPKSLYIN